VERPAGLQQLPVVVGIYMSPQFRAYRHVESREGSEWQFALGQASVSLLERALPLLFKAVVPVAGRPPLDGGPVGIVAVLEATLEGFAFALPYLAPEAYTAEIRYRFTLYSTAGEPVATWRVRGEGSRSGTLGLEQVRWVGEATDLAMQDAATQLVRGFREVPDLRRWLERIGASS